MKRLLIVVAIHLSFFSGTASATEVGSLEQCQKIQKGIEYYTKLTNSGGKSSQLERWGKSLAERELEFQENGCRKYGVKIAKATP